MPKFLFVSRSALIHDLAWEVIKERHEVSGDWDKYEAQLKAARLRLSNQTTAWTSMPTTRSRAATG